MPTFSLTIDGVSIPKSNCIMPAKYNDHLDEQLDMATVSVFGVTTEIFKPFCKVTITAEGAPRENEPTIVKHYRLMSDMGTESPNGTGKYRHDLTLIEETKFLEGFLVESLCVTNAGGRQYTQVTPTIDTAQGDKPVDILFTDDNKTPYAISDLFNLPNITPFSYSGTGMIDYQQTIKVTLTNSKNQSGTVVYNNTSTSFTGTVNQSVSISSGANVFEYEYSYSYNLHGADVSVTQKSTFTIYGQPNYYPLKPWTYKEVIERALELCEPRIWNKTATRTEARTQSVTVYPTGTTGRRTFSETIAVTDGTVESISITNKSELIPLGIIASASVRPGGFSINGTAPEVGYASYIIDVSYTVSMIGDYVVPPRFNFRYNDPNDAHEIDVFDNLAPEFTFTRCTLRELLQEIGGALNKEPRLDENDNVYFVDFGGKETATFLSAKTNTVKLLNQYPYIKKTQSWELEQACTRLDAHVDNFVNQISVGDATVGQPYLDGAQSLRTDSAYVRVTEETAIFPSALPILKINAFRWVDRDGLAGNTWARYDITNFVFEKTVYDSQLSNYSTAYPVSKAYGIYYTQGEKNIGGLFFENTEWSGGIFANPAIVNILRAVTGNNSLLSGASAADYAKLCFELEYIPIYSARVQHGKQYTGDFLAFPRTIAHNQSANMVEAQYYGENIKGMAERLGNVEKAFTFQCRYASTIPQAGQKWDDDYFISDVAVEITNPCFKVTVGLTKNFNRMSKYIGANSYRRIYEVSERMVQERNTIYTDYLVIVPDSYMAPMEYSADFLFGFYGFTGVYSTFTQTRYSIATRFGIMEKVSSVRIQGETKNGNETLPEVILPVVASAFGNVMEFSYSFQDNFSAGQKIVYQQNDNITGYFTTEVQYCDYYGRMYYENIDFLSVNTTTASNTPPTNPDELPEYVTYVSNPNLTRVAGTGSNTPIICRKDSREALSGVYAVEFVTTMKDYVIGSALASNNIMVSGMNANAKAQIVILQNPIDKLSRYVDLSAGNVAATYEVGINLLGTFDTPYIRSLGVSATAAGAAWAIVTPKYNGTSYTVEDEDGNTETFTPQYGGELLVGQNTTVNVGDTIARFKIVGTHDIFKFIEEQED